MVKNEWSNAVAPHCKPSCRRQGQIYLLLFFQYMGDVDDCHLPHANLYHVLNVNGVETSEILTEDGLRITVTIDSVAVI